MRTSRQPVRVRTVLLAASVAVLMSVDASGQGGWSRATDHPGFGIAGRVFSLGTWRNELVAGTYRNVFKDGNYLNHIAHYDGERWLPFGSGVDGPVRAVCEFNGDLWIGGEFSYAGSTPVARVARWDGTRWSAAGPGFDGVVWDLAVHGGELYAGGSFTTSGSRLISRIARWDGNDWQPVGGGMTWNLGMYASVRSLFSDGTLLYAGGEFDRAGATPASHIAVWDGTSWRALGSGVNNFGWGTVWTITGWGGRVYVGGAFGQAGAVLADKIAAWDGSAWSAVGPGVQGTIYGAAVEALAVYGGELYVAGSFNHAGALATDRIARWDGTQFHAIGGVSLAEANPPTIIAMTTWNGRLYCGGEFQVAGHPFVFGATRGVYHITSFDGTNWDAVGRGLGFSHAVMTLGRWRGQTVAGGAFQIAGGSYVTSLALFDGNDWQPLANVNGVVHQVLEHQGDLYVAGEFRDIAGLPANGIARYDGTRWYAFGNGPNLYGAWCVAIYQGQIHVGTMGNPQRWNGAAWESFTPQVFGVIQTMHVHNGVLYMGGATPFMSGTPNLFSWDGTSFQVVGGGTNDTVVTLASLGNDLLVGGSFTMVGGVPARCIARWNGSAWSTFGAGVQGAVVAGITTLGGELYVCGDFSRWQGENAEYVARWDGSRWQSLPGGDPDGAVWSMLADEARGELHVGGHFWRVGNVDADNYALWQRTPSWTDLGNALPSTRRTPILWGEGSLVRGASTHLAVSSALENAPSALAIGGQRIDLPLLGGTLVPSPDVTIPALTTPIGTLVLDFPWPLVAPRTALYLQAWTFDPLGPQGITATNGLWLRVP